MPMNVDSGFEVVRAFEAEGEVHPVAPPPGEAVAAVQVGSYDRIGVEIESLLGL
jgi:hypothetical protein